MQLRNRTYHLLFPTPIWEYHFEDCEEFNDKLFGDVMSFDWEAYKEENRLSFGDSLTSRSEDTFIPLDRAPGIMFVLKTALEKAHEAAEDYGWDLQRNELRADEYWANVNKTNEYNMHHNHAPAHLSGVYYVRVPENSGDIRFVDDRKVRTVTEPNSINNSPISVEDHTFKPEEGMLLLFPGWLEHFVDQNKSETARVSISFNIELNKKKNG